MIGVFSFVIFDAPAQSYLFTSLFVFKRCSFYLEAFSSGQEALLSLSIGSTVLLSDLVVYWQWESICDLKFCYFWF